MRRRWPPSGSWGAVRGNRLSGTGAPVADSRYLPGAPAGKPLPGNLSPPCPSASCFAFRLSLLVHEFARFVSRSGLGCQSGIGNGNLRREGLTMRGQADEPAVVTLPAEIEQDSAGLALDGADSVLDGVGPAYAALREAVASGAPVVVADLTGTTFCDYPGFHQLVAIHQLAAISDVQLRLAMPADGNRATLAGVPGVPPAGPGVPGPPGGHDGVTRQPASTARLVPRQQAASRPAAADGLGAQRRVTEQRQADDAVARGVTVAEGRYRLARPRPPPLTPTPPPGRLPLRRGAAGSAGGSRVGTATASTSW